MGYNLYRLGIIKAKLVASHPNDLKSLFKFLEEQLGDQELENSSGLDLPKLRKIKSNISEITPREVETVLDFVAERIPLCRTSDNAAKILENLDKIEFYSRGLRYSKIEKFIFTITSP